MSLGTCYVDTCDNLGTFPLAVDVNGGDRTVVMACFDHAGEGDPPAGWEDQGAPAEPDGGFHTDVVAGLASLLLEHAMMTTLPGEDPAGDTMRSLAASTGWTLDVAAGVLMALTWLMAAGEVDEDMLARGAEQFEQQAEADELDELAAELPGGDGDQADGDPFSGEGDEWLRRLTTEVDREPLAVEVADGVNVARRSGPLGFVYVASCGRHGELIADDDPRRALRAAVDHAVAAHDDDDQAETVEVDDQAAPVEVDKVPVGTVPAGVQDNDERTDDDGDN